MAQPSLPRGWKIVSLHYADPGREPRIGPRPSDAQIAQADTIRVSYTPPGASEPIAHRQVHGANSRRHLGDVIDSVTRVASPV